MSSSKENVLPLTSRFAVVPDSLDSLIVPKDLLPLLSRFLSEPSADLPHCLFHGPSGSGKTTLVRFLASKIQQRNNEDKKNVILYDASANRSVGEVRLKIQQLRCEAWRSKHLKFRIVVFEEADALTVEAQTILMNPLEEMSHVRFIFLCNSPGLFLPALLSRCHLFAFPEPTPVQIEGVLQNTIAKLNADIPRSCVSLVASRSHGDVRGALSNIVLMTHPKTRNVFVEMWEKEEKMMDAWLLLMMRNTDRCSSGDILLPQASLLAHYFTDRALSMSSLCDRLQALSCPVEQWERFVSTQSAHVCYLKEHMSLSLFSRPTLVWFYALMDFEIQLSLYGREKSLLVISLTKLLVVFLRESQKILARKKG